MITEQLQGRGAEAADRGVKLALAGSWMLGTADRAADAMVRAMDLSMAAQRASWLREAWGGLPRASRRHAIGTALLAGVATHIGLTAWQELPAGWLWLLVPALIAGIGALCLLASDETDS